MDLIQLTERLMLLPSAPGFESWVRAFAQTFCNDNGIPCYEDAAGNLWLNVATKEEIPSAKLVFTAHMDHPAIEITSVSGKWAKGTWLGGGPKHLRGARVELFRSYPNKETCLGTVYEASVENEQPSKVIIELDTYTETKFDAACLYFKGMPTRYAGYVMGRATDDLVSVALLLDAFRARPKGMVGLLTRKEETHLRGAFDCIKEHLLDAKARVIVVETTEASTADVSMGKGPVIRYGDSDIVYSVDFVDAIRRVAEHLKGTNFNYQIQYASRGKTEADAFNMVGFPIAGISIPINGYHNKTVIGQVTVEVVSIADLKQTLTLLGALVGKA